MSTPSQALGQHPVSPVRPAIGRTLGAWRFRIGRVIPHGVQLAAVAVIAFALVALSYGMNHMSYIIWGAFWVAPVLLILSVPLANRAARIDGDAIGRIVLVAATLKILVAPLLRYWMSYGLYGSSDATHYHLVGSQLAPLFREGIYSNLGQISGTRFIEILTGQIYALTGATRFGGFVLFSWFAFLGLYLFYRGFCIAYPDGDKRRYAILVFFFPSLFFWPSSIGKEAFMTLALGAAVIGAAQLFAGRLRGFVCLALGLWGAAIVRPHMALIVGAGLVVAGPLAATRRGGRRRSRLGGIVLVLGLLLAGPTLIGVAQTFFGLESLNAETAQELLDETTRRSSKRGSTFTPMSPNNPLGFAVSGVTVLFRPFPVEADNVQSLFASAEGLGLVALIALSLRRIARAPRDFFRNPFMAFALVYVFAFVYAFSSIANFGLLVRERSQLLPVLFVILCIQQAGAVRRRGNESPDSDQIGNTSIISRRLR